MVWLVSCSRQWMLIQGPTPDPKCELNITSFFTLPYPLHCPICAKDIMVTVLLLQVMVGSEGWRVFHLCQGLGGGTGGGYHVFSNFCSVFVLLLFFHGCFLCLFQCSFFAFFVSGPFSQALLVHGNFSVCFLKLFQKSGFRSLICGSS